VQGRVSDTADCRVRRIRSLSSDSFCVLCALHGQAALTPACQASGPPKRKQGETKIFPTCIRKKRQRVSFSALRSDLGRHEPQGPAGIAREACADQAACKGEIAIRAKEAAEDHRACFTVHVCPIITSYV
jgi:hypothetical protein